MSGDNGSEPVAAGRPLGLDPAGLRIVVGLELVFALAQLALGACLLAIVGQLGDTRAGWAVVAVLLALCLAAIERLATGHERAALLLASLPAVACLLIDAWMLSGGPGRS